MQENTLEQIQKYQVVYAFDREEVIVKPFESMNTDMRDVCAEAMAMIAAESGATDWLPLLAFSVLRLEA